MSKEDMTFGEPFAMNQKRLLFTNWDFIRPSGFSWLDDDGIDISVFGNATPEEAKLTRSDEPHGVRIRSYPAERMGPILGREKPWEKNRMLIETLIQEDGVFRAWGFCGPNPVRNDMGVVENLFCYLESENGMKWTRPSLGLVEHGRHKKTNLLPSKGGFVFLDPEGKPSERYKWISAGNITRKQFEQYRKEQPDAWDPRCIRRDVAEWSEDFPEGIIVAVLGAISPDGLKWKQLARPLSIEHSDTQIVAYYDPQLKRYVSYTRYWMPRLRGKAAGDETLGLTWLKERRAIGRAETSDFRQFPASKSLLEPGPDMGPSDVFYTNCRTSVPGAPNQHLMFPAVWDMSTDSTYHIMYSSSDGSAWHRVPGESVLETGAFGEWDGGCVFACPNLIELPDGTFALPYNGFNVPHKYPRAQWEPYTGYAIWPNGRIAAVEARERGRFSTYGLVIPGGRIRLNVRTRRGGSVRVEAAGMNGEVLPGRSFQDSTPVVGDHPRALVRWGALDDLNDYAAAGVILRFELDRAELFSLEFA